MVVPLFELSVPSDTEESHQEKLAFCVRGVPQAFSAVAVNICTSKGATSTFAGLDENDPKSVARMMRKMGKEMGDEFGGAEFDEAVDELESGGDLGGGDDEFGGGGGGEDDF